jgi:hypothetical protein
LLPFAIQLFASGDKLVAGNQPILRSMNFDDTQADDVSRLHYPPDLHCPTEAADHDFSTEAIDLGPVVELLHDVIEAASFHDDSSACRCMASRFRGYRRHVFMRTRELRHLMGMAERSSMEQVIECAIARIPTLLHALKTEAGPSCL